MLLPQAPAASVGIAVIPVGDGAEATALSVLQMLRGAGLRAEMAYRGNLKRRLERANRIGARAAVILGDAEIAASVANVKDLASGTQKEVPLSGLVAHFS
jgi:histidyl-tRNA synthetase